MGSVGSRWVVGLGDHRGLNRSVINVYFSGSCFEIKSHFKQAKSNFHFNSNVSRVGLIYFRFLLVW